MARERPRLPCARGAVEIGFSEPILTEGLLIPIDSDPSGAVRHLPLRRGGFGCGQCIGCPRKDNRYPCRKHFGIDNFTFECYDSFNIERLRRRGPNGPNLREVAVGASHGRGHSVPVAPKPEGRTQNASRTLPRQLRQCLGLAGAR